MSDNDSNDEDDYQLYEKKVGNGAVVKVTSDLKHVHKNGVKKFAKDKWGFRKENYVKCNVKENLKKKKVSLTSPANAALNLDPGDFIEDVVNNFDRPGGTDKKGVYSMAGLFCFAFF